MSDQILAIKRAFTCAKILSNHVNIKPSGPRFYLSHCPFCQTDAPAKAKPKFWINHELDLCNCFSPSCASERPMDVINLYARLERMSNRDAIHALYTLTGEHTRE